MTNAQHTNENLTIHHKIKNYATRRKGYDGHEKSRLSVGIANGRVLRKVNSDASLVDRI